MFCGHCHPTRQRSDAAVPAQAEEAIVEILALFRVLRCERSCDLRRPAEHEDDGDDERRNTGDHGPTADPLRRRPDAYT